MVQKFRADKLQAYLRSQLQQISSVMLLDKIRNTEILQLAGLSSRIETHIDKILQ